MAVKIRLARGGAKKRPFYSIVVADIRSPRDGKFIEKIGTFNPLLSDDHPEKLVLKEDRAKHWIGTGAKPTDRVAKLMAKLGLDHDQLRAEKPELIYAASQGYGRGGPMGDKKAYGPLNAAFAGIHLLWSHPDGPYPSGTAMNHPDHIAGKMLATAVLAALDHRERTGEGQFVELSQAEAAVYLLGDQYLAAIESGIDPVNLGNRHPSQAPHGVYPADGDDAWIAIAIPDDDAWRRLEAACGWETDPSLATSEARLASVDEIDERLAAWTRDRDKNAAAADLQQAGVSAMPVMGPLDHLADPHLLGRAAFDEVEHPVGGTEHHIANPTRFSRTPTRTAGPAPCLGADTRRILSEWLGLDDAELDRLAETGALT
mgnify:CR=1 FL=1